MWSLEGAREEMRRQPIVAEAHARLARVFLVVEQGSRAYGAAAAAVQAQKDALRKLPQLPPDLEEAQKLNRFALDCLAEFAEEARAAMLAPPRSRLPGCDGW